MTLGALTEPRYPRTVGFRGRVAIELNPLFEVLASDQKRNSLRRRAERVLFDTKDIFTQIATRAFENAMATASALHTKAGAGDER